MKKKTSDFLLRQWLHGGWLSTSLLPAAWLLQRIAGLRRQLYAAGKLRSWRAPVPVVVVGNVFVGGTGKTPLTAALCAYLNSQGFHPGIVSRGYGIKTGKHPRLACANADAAYIGDEPALLAQYAPIAIHPDRPLAARALLAACPDIDVLISDDGLQHLALARDLEIIVQDQRGIGNGRMLPAGPLREPPGRLQQADYIVTNYNHLPPPAASAGPAANAAAIAMQLQPDVFVHLQSGRRLSPEAWRRQHHSAGNRLCIAAGIGNPQRFLQTVRSLGIHEDQFLTLGDHHPFSRQDLAAIQAPLILMTEKDAVKCKVHADDRIWFLRVAARFEPADFLPSVLERITALRRHR